MLYQLSQRHASGTESDILRTIQPTFFIPFTCRLFLVKTLSQMPENDHPAVDLESQHPTHPPEALTKDEKPDEKSCQVMEKETEYLTGWRLWSLILATTTVGFLLMLDSSIVSTVRLHMHTYKATGLIILIGHPASYQRVSFVARCQLVRRIVPVCQVRWTLPPCRESCC